MMHRNRIRVAVRLLENMVRAIYSYEPPAMTFYQLFNNCETLFASHGVAPVIWTSMSATPCRTVVSNTSTLSFLTRNDLAHFVYSVSYTFNLSTDSSL